MSTAKNPSFLVILGEERWNHRNWGEPPKTSVIPNAYPVAMGEFSPRAGLLSGDPTLFSAGISSECDGMDQRRNTDRFEVDIKCKSLFVCIPINKINIVLQKLKLLFL